MLMCTEGVPLVLTQHLPVMCSLRKVPVAVIAATPTALARVISQGMSTSRNAACSAIPRASTAGGIATLGSGVADNPGHSWARAPTHAVAVAVLRECSTAPRLVDFCERLRASAPAVQLPFLLPVAGAGVASVARTRARDRGARAAGETKKKTKTATVVVAATNSSAQAGTPRNLQEDNDLRLAAGRASKDETMISLPQRVLFQSQPSKPKVAARQLGHTHAKGQPQHGKRRSEIVTRPPSVAASCSRASAIAEAAAVGTHAAPPVASAPDIYDFFDSMS